MNLMYFLQAVSFVLQAAQTDENPFCKTNQTAPTKYTKYTSTPEAREQAEIACQKEADALIESSKSLFLYVLMYMNEYI